MQYDEWKEAVGDILRIQSGKFPRVENQVEFSDPTSNAAIDISYYTNRMAMVERAAYLADEQISIYILKAVTKGLSYDQVKAKDSIPCGKDYFYDRYRKFFYILDKIRM